MSQDTVRDEVERHEQEISRGAACLEVLHAIGATPEAGWVYAGKYSEKVTVEIQPAEGFEPLEVVATLLGRLHQRVAKKTFSNVSGMMSYIIETPTATISVLGGAPKRCEVEKVETEVAVPARTEKQTVYWLKDPKCLEAAHGRMEEPS